MSTIVVGYDASEGARAALDEALSLASQLEASVHLVFAYQAPRIGGELRDLDDAIEERGRGMLEHGKHQAAAAGFEVTTEYLKADHAEGLIEAADRLDARMIVVGSCGERPLKSALVGSTPTRLLHLSARPLLVVRTPE